MTLDLDLEEDRAVIRALLTSSVHALSKSGLTKDYFNITGKKEIPFKKYGFSSLREFMEAIPSIRVCSRNEEILYEAEPTQKTKHIVDLVKGQKQNIKKPVVQKRWYGPNNDRIKEHQNNQNARSATNTKDNNRNGRDYHFNQNTRKEDHTERGRNEYKPRQFTHEMIDQNKKKLDRRHVYESKRTHSDEIRHGQYTPQDGYMSSRQRDAPINIEEGYHSEVSGKFRDNGRYYERNFREDLKEKEHIGKRLNTDHRHDEFKPRNFARHGVIPVDEFVEFDNEGNYANRREMYSNQGRSGDKKSYNSTNEPRNRYLSLYPERSTDGRYKGGLIHDSKYVTGLNSKIYNSEDYKYNRRNDHPKSFRSNSYKTEYENLDRRLKEEKDNYLPSGRYNSDYFPTYWEDDNNGTERFIVMSGEAKELKVRIPNDLYNPNSMGTSDPESTEDPYSWESHRRSFQDRR